MFGGIKKCCNFALEFNNGILLVVWMSGLVTGLQNRLRRFESANHLKSVNAAMCSHFLFVFSRGVLKIVANATFLSQNPVVFSPYC